MSVEFKAIQDFDSNKMRQYLNGEVTVMHCHHYSALFSQLADDAEMFNGAKLLAEAAEESMNPVLIKYYADNGIESEEDKVQIAEQYFAFIGLGKVKINVSGDGGSAEMDHSHVDEGWVKKWKKRDKPVNYIGQGYLAAAFSAITGNACGTFQVEETQSIVAGAESSKFTISKK
jgi:predicted hydrocarbon binding protein